MKEKNYCGDCKYFNDAGLGGYGICNDPYLNCGTGTHRNNKACSLYEKKLNNNEKKLNNNVNEDNRKKAIKLVNAYFDNKEIIMKDPEAGIHHWISIKHPEYWSFLEEFCKNVNKYRIIEEESK